MKKVRPGRTLRRRERHASAAREAWHPGNRRHGGAALGHGTRVGKTQIVHAFKHGCASRSRCITTAPGMRARITPTGVRHIYGVRCTMAAAMAYEPFAPAGAAMPSVQRRHARLELSTSQTWFRCAGTMAPARSSRCRSEAKHPPSIRLATAGPNRLRAYLNKRDSWRRAG